MTAASNRSRWTRIALAASGSLLVVGVVGAGWWVVDEARTSRRQAAWLSAQAPALGFSVQPGPTPDPRFPTGGPFDDRLGHSRIPEFVQRLDTQGFAVGAQARMSPRMVELVDRGLHAPFRESSQAGLDVRDCRGEPLALARYPQRVFERFDRVPRLLVDALLFIEDQQLLDAEHPMRNPALEWDRFGKAVFDQGLRRLTGSHAAAGGSTLATQIEKYRHSPEGRTSNAQQKLRQMASASLRAYLDGPDTRPRRRQIVLDYLNTVPLSAKPGFGEVNGLGDGLWAWYGRDFAAVRALLEATDTPGAGREFPSAAQALAFKQALSLMVAQRRPSHYLADGAPELQRLTDTYLRLLADAGTISRALRDVALAQPLALRPGLPDSAAGESFVDRKAGTLMRARLQSLLGMPRAYDLDRLDLRVRSPLDGRVQRTATELLRGLADPATARAAGLYGFRLLADGQDPSKLRFSFTLYERGETGNLLRAQTDNFDQPFDLNDGARLDLGSTSKLRTLATYLEMVAELHRRWSGLSAAELAAVTVAPRDTIGRWTRDALLHDEDRGLRHLLDRAMERVYSASPAEGFYTGGGLHHFDNFDKADDGRTMTWDPLESTCRHASLSIL